MEGEGDKINFAVWDIFLKMYPAFWVLTPRDKGGVALLGLSPYGEG